MLDGRPAEATRAAADAGEAPGALVGSAMLAVAAGRPDEAQRDVSEALDRLRTGPAPVRCFAEVLLGNALTALGDWAAADEHLALAASLATDHGQRWLKPLTHAEAAHMAVSLGDYARAEEHLAATRRSPAYRDGGNGRRHALRAASFLALVTGDPRAALTARNELPPYAAGGAPADLPWRLLLAEAELADGHAARAAGLLAPLLGPGPVPAPIRAGALRVTAGISAAAGDPDRAESALDEALLTVHGTPDPLERARIHLDLGCLLRRRGLRGRAATELRAASPRLEALGAVPYLQRARQELRACGSTPAPAEETSSHTPTRHRPSPTTAPSEPLTAQETAVMHLVCEGLSNRAVAKSLSLSIKTVEYHLSRIYRKFSIASRTELMAMTFRHTP
ncbi:LuxR C-terminal-related transcriptional regulator [Streptomyces sp. NPDC008238]